MSITLPTNQFYSNFQVKNHASSIPYSHLVDLGATSRSIPVTSIMAGHFSVSPISDGQTYTLPTCSQLALALGNRNVNDGSISLSANTIYPLKIVNKGTAAAILAGTTGSTSACMLPATSALTSTGAGSLGGGETNVSILFTAINASQDGVTGTYSLL